MLSRIRNYAFVALGGAAFYFLLAHHFLFNSLSNIDLLKKTELTLKYTFISVRQIKPAKLLRVDALYNAGLGDYLVERGFISESKLERILDQIDKEIEAEGGAEN